MSEDETLPGYVPGGWKRRKIGAKSWAYMYDRARIHMCIVRISLRPSRRHGAISLTRTYSIRQVCTRKGKEDLCVMPPGVWISSRPASRPRPIRPRGWPARKRGTNACHRRKRRGEAASCVGGHGLRLPGQRPREVEQRPTIPPWTRAKRTYAHAIPHHITERKSHTTPSATASWHCLTTTKSTQA